MNILMLVFVYIVGATLLAFFRANSKIIALASSILFLIFMVFGTLSVIASAILLFTAVLFILLSIDNIRRSWVSAPLFSWYRKVLPSVSETEQVAIDAGTVWWEGDLFTGNPEWQKLLAMPKPELTQDEQAFLDGPVEQLCSMVNTWDINFKHADIPDDIVDFIKKNKFLGLIIPKEFGGLDLSPVAQVMVLNKLFSAGGVIGLFISVPNSLGPGELLVKYGTEQQKNHFLPRLASGEDIPCFALTAPLAGSDATSIPDTGVVCKGTWEGKEIVGMKLNIDKRYITLAPLATLVGLAFKLEDPDHLIGNVDEHGITCALIPRQTPGLKIGRRHYPIGDPFHNGPIQGTDIFVPLDFIIGGKEMAGHGWRMLVECLSTGRCISLPSISNSIAKNSLASTTAYARIRRQFNLPIAEFEGIQKPIARMAGFSFIINAATIQTAMAISRGAKPAVPASILKYHCTEMSRRATIDAMDIQGGKAVMKGPNNTLSAAYESAPVAITVEGANIMTRSLMIFGQGAIRCHPYVLKEMQLAVMDDKKQATEEFDDVLFKHIANAYRNGAHAVIHALSFSLFTGVRISSYMKRYYRYGSRLSAAFAVIADIAMMTMQASLKRREMISARLGDLLSMLYLLSMVLKQYKDLGEPKELNHVVDWSCQYLLHQYQVSMHEILRNLPNRPAAWKMKLIMFPLGEHFHMPSDKLERTIADQVTHNTETRNMLIDGVYLTPNENNPIGKMNEILALAEDMEPLLQKLKAAVKSKQVPNLLSIALIDAAEQAEIVNKEEASRLREFDNKVMSVINVDDFEYTEFSRPESAA